MEKHYPEKPLNTSGQCKMIFLFGHPVLSCGGRREFHEFNSTAIPSIPAKSYLPSPYTRPHWDAAYPVN